MPYKNKEQYNAYLAEYMKEHWKKRRLWAINFLGGKCVRCGTLENLEFDHKDPEEKKHEITSGLKSASEKRFLEELMKCQLLCNSCHKIKTSEDRRLP